MWLGKLPEQDAICAAQVGSKQFLLDAAVAVRNGVFRHGQQKLSGRVEGWGGWGVGGLG